MHDIPVSKDLSGGDTPYPEPVVPIVSLVDLAAPRFVSLTSPPNFPFPLSIPLVIASRNKTFPFAHP